MSPDKINSNLLGLNRSGSVNIHTKMKTALQEKVIGWRCTVHVVHNTCRTAINTIPIDIEDLLRKAFGYRRFNINTESVEDLKNFCLFFRKVHQTFLSHSTVRWLSMLSAVERILQMYAPLKPHFLSVEKCPAVLRKLFDGFLKKLWLTFVHANLMTFGGTIQQLERQDYYTVKTGKN